MLRVTGRFRERSMAKESSSQDGGPGRNGNDTPTIVAIGASAGGIQALQKLIGALPDQTGAAFVVIVHLDPQRRSDLPRILASRTKMSVVQVEGTEKIEA